MTNQDAEASAARDALTSGEDRDGDRTAGRLATAAALAVIAAFVAGKAARDAILLSTFPVTSLPMFIGGTALLSLPLVVLAGRWMARLGPARLMPRLYALSAVLLGAEYLALARWPRLAAIACFFHLGSLGAVLVSGFWSVVNERFDARSAKRLIGRIGLGATIGGILGGVVAERAAVYLQRDAILLLLAGLQLLSGLALRGLAGPPHAEHDVDTLAAGETAASVKATLRSPLLRNLSLLVLLGAVAATSLDYVFKAEVTEAARGNGGTLRLFGIYHTVTNILTAVAQVALSRAAVSRLGVARAIGVLPTVVTVSAGSALLVPGLWAAVLARGAEMITRSSIYRAAYELVFAPLPERDKRSTKVVLDVGAERVGDLLGSQLVAALLLLTAPRWSMLALALAAGLVGLAIAAMLPRSYTSALEDSLRRRAAAGELEPEPLANAPSSRRPSLAPGAAGSGPRAAHRSRAATGAPGGGAAKAAPPPAEGDAALDRNAPWVGRSTLAETGDLTGLSLLNLQLLSRSQTHPGLPSRKKKPSASGTRADTASGDVATADTRPARPALTGAPGTGRPAAGIVPDILGNAGALMRPRDPLAVAALELRSGDADRVHAALAHLEPELVPLAIPLLAWHSVSAAAADALRAIAPRATGALADALLDGDREFAIRRRLPTIVAAGHRELAHWALWRALSDSRFEVRYRSARALAELREEGDAPEDFAAVMALVRRELSVSKDVWRSYQLLDNDLDASAASATARAAPGAPTGAASAAPAASAAARASTGGAASATSAATTATSAAAPASAVWPKRPTGEAAKALLEILRRRSATGLYHVFTLLGLTFPAEPMQLAFQGVCTDDRAVRATALEYLESTLPPDIRALLWPFIAADELAPPSGRGRQELAESLRLSYPTILANLQRLAEHVEP